MVEELYEAMAPGVPFAALLLSLFSLFVSLRNRTDQRTEKLLAKKTEAIHKIAQRQAKLGQLALIYSQKLQLLRFTFRASPDSAEQQRIDNNLRLILEQKEFWNEHLEKLRAAKPTDLEAWETILSDANELLAHDSSELEKEENALKDLRNILTGN